MDPQIRQILANEQDRQLKGIQLIASENFASQPVRELCGSEFTNKYAEGYPGRRYYNGCSNMDAIEQMAIDLACELYGCNHANVQPHSGANANFAIMQAFLKPGDRILAMDLAHGGHLSHGAGVNWSGKTYEVQHYGVNSKGFINYDLLWSQAQEFKPKMLIAGGSSYPRQIQWNEMRKIATRVGAFLLADMAHYSGLVAGGAYQSPIDTADFTTSTTHKTLRGPRGGMILWNNQDYTKKINAAVFPGTQGGPLMNIVAAKAQAYKEALSPEFKDYSRSVRSNAEAMAEQFDINGLEVITGGTDCHMILLDLTNTGISGRQAADVLEANGITVNKNGIPNDPKSFTETSGIRIGTAAETTRGRNQQWFRDLADTITGIIKDAGTHS